ncbi:MAG: efflux RND transporter periplasmic adaptor subunit [Muribaculaceae bacterium]
MMLMSAISALAIMTSCSQGKEEKSSSLIIRSTYPTLATERENEDYSFIAQPWRTSELSFRVSGPINHLDAYPGNSYKQGSIIAEIDARDFRIRKERAEAAYKQLEAENKRVTTLFEKDNVSASQFEKIRADYITAKTTYEEASNQLEDTRLTAPFDGYIGEVYIEKYQDVKAAQPVVSLIDINNLKIEIYVTQDVAQTAQNAGEIRLVFDTEPNRSYNAKVVDVSKSTMSNNLSYLLTAKLPNFDGHLLAGMSGKAQLPAAATATAEVKGVEIPLAALCHTPVEGDYVWVLDSKKSVVNKRKVKCGQLQPGGKITIIQGLDVNDEIATSGMRLLSDGQKVELCKAC